MRLLERGRLKETLHKDQRRNFLVFDVRIMVLGVGGDKMQKHVFLLLKRMI